MPIPFPDFDMRLPPMGPTFEGVNDGDTFVWNATTKKWNIGPGGGAGVTEFDFLISTRADLVAAVGAPVGGEFLLVDGSYFFKEEVDLDDGERVAADGVDVFIMGGGREGVLDRGWNGNFASSEAAFVVRNGANVTLYNLRIGAVQIARHGILVEDTSDIEFFDCDIPTSTGGSQPALEMTGTGTLRATRTFFGGALAAVEITGAVRVNMTDCECVAGLGGDGLNVTLGAVDADMHFRGCRFGGSAPGGQAVQLDAAQLDVFFIDCEFDGPQPAQPVCVIDALSSIQVVGGFMFNSSGTPGDGWSIDGNIAGGAQFLGQQAEELDDFIIRTAGTQNRVVVADCDTAADVATGVDWATASIPTNGLLEHGNQFNTLTPFQNHASTDARVNRKCNSLQGGLSTETAIVP